MTQNSNIPTKYNLEFIEIVWQHLSNEQLTEFDKIIKQEFNDWELTAFKELATTVSFIKSQNTT